MSDDNVFAGTRYMSNVEKLPNGDVRYVAQIELTDWLQAKLADATPGERGEWERYISDLMSRELSDRMMEKIDDDLTRLVPRKAMGEHDKKCTMVFQGVRFAGFYKCSGCFYVHVDKYGRPNRCPNCGRMIEEWRSDER